MSNFVSCPVPIRGRASSSSSDGCRQGYVPASFDSLDECDSGISSLASDASREGSTSTPSSSSGNSTSCFRTPRLLRDSYGRCFAAVLRYKLVSDDNPHETSWCQGLFRTQPLPPGVSTTNYHSDDAFVELHMWPNSAGRYGFHVEVCQIDGAVRVSRVVENTPADRCCPRLSEGDTLVTVNGVPMDGLDRGEVVRLIREHGRNPCTPMRLVVKPRDSRTQPHNSPMPLLKESLYYLRRDYNSEQLIFDFLCIPRGNARLSMEVARTPENLPRNRYRDILPYDKSRVRLHLTPSDYINASHINMEIPQTGIVNKFIATQAPTLATCQDFWWMCWQQNTPVVVMLTPVSEHGSLKCHRYWPDTGEEWKFGPLSVSCRAERLGCSVAMRDLLLHWRGGGPPRQVTQLQYTAWPDHGVPDSVDRFLDFTRTASRLRDGHLGPTVVHCSAGVGRTGVLMLVDTATALADAGLPVMPLDLVRAMREQRPGMVQTAEQFAFACRTILRICNA